MSRVRHVMIALTALVVLAPRMAAADKAWIYFPAEQYIHSSADERTAYVAALSDTLASMTINGEFDAQWFVDCRANRLTLAQLTALFDQWLLANPDLWQEATPGLFAKAMGRACGM